jgi:predicted lactoylglutathione lyase
MSENQDIFSSYSAEEQQAVALLKEQFRKNFEGKNLSKCSMDSLVMRCLEVES